MANEAVPIELNGLNAVQRTVAEATTIEKYTLLALTDPNTAAASAAAEAFGGIAAAEKEGGDGSTTLSAYITGVFDLTTVGPAITVGDWVSLSGANLIKEATEAEIQSGRAIGKAEETSTAGSEVIRVRLIGS